MNDSNSPIKWSIEQRLTFIEFRLLWEGRVNRSDLMRQFSISKNQAALDLGQYLTQASGNMEYNRLSKTYEPTDRFSPQFLEQNTTSYFTQLRSVSEGIVERENSWIGQFPDLGSVPIPMRGVPVAVLQNVLRAIRSETSIEISYQSLSRPDPVWRWIAPHAIGYDGFRWHVRAWCEIDNVFKDFLFSRIRDIRGAHLAPVKSAEDVDWHSYVEMVIGPHPDLSDGQKAVIADDYGMVEGRIVLTVRKALLYYALKRFGLDLDPSTRRPQDQQIVLLNRTKLFPSSNIQTGPK